MIDMQECKPNRNLFIANASWLWLPKSNLSLIPPNFFFSRLQPDNFRSSYLTIFFKGTVCQDVALICSAGCGLNAKRQRKWMWHLKQLVMRESKRLRIVLKLSPTKQQCFVRTLRAQVQISSSKYTNLSVGCNYWCISDSESLFLLKILDFVVGFRPRSFESYYRTDVQSWW